MMSTPHRWIRPRTALVVAALVAVIVTSAVAPFVAAGAQAAAAPREPVVTVGNVTTSPGETATVPVTLSAAPDGLAGYELGVTVDDAGVAEVVGANYTDTGLTSPPRVGDDGTTVRLKAADVDRRIDPGATDVVLVWLELRAGAAGETALSVDVRRMDDDDGDPVGPATDSGRFAVRDAGRTTATATAPPGTTARGGGERRAGSPLPVGSDTAAVLGAAAVGLVLAGLGLARRR
jgi:hypothetical protein